MTFLPLLISFLTSVLLVPIIRWFSFRVGRIVQPRKERWHSLPTPTLGGVGMFIAFVISILVIIVIKGNLGNIQGRWSILLGIVLMFALGVYDDFKPINPPVKFAGQILAATLVIFFGNNTINFFPWPIANIILTFFWLVGITNAINLLDNMDGLAGGVALIASLFLSYFFWRSDHTELLLLSIALAGSILGFLLFNFPPAKIFMGDSGSMFLGFALASLAVARRTQASNVFAVMGVPTLLFLLPILDTGLVTITRILRGQSPTRGGTDHTSHRLIAFGLSERQAVIVLYCVAIISGIASIALEALDYDLSLVLIPILLIILSLFVAYLGRMKVVTSTPQSNGGIFRLVINLTYKRRLFEIAFDLLLIGLSYYLAYWTRSGLNMTTSSMSLFLQSWAMALGITYLSFYVFGVYRGVWRYIGFNDLIRYAGAAMTSGGIAWVAVNVIFPSSSYTGDVFILYIIILLLGLAGSRSSFQILDRIYSQRFSRMEKTNVLLYGAEDAGEIALRWILRNPELRYYPIGFLDDDSLKWGRSIHGVPIMCGVENIGQILVEKQVSGIIITTHNLLKSPAGEQLLAVCRAQGVWVRILRLEFELTE
jgi:UDP-GlcNAc:undecaprenyl-phosphate/decaprenyl-phosphate GlcNAc-1-phosphate transferase